MTDAQLERQIKKIKKVIFKDLKEFDDGSYKGEIAEGVQEILLKNIPLDTPIDEEGLQQIIFKTATKLTIWLIKNTTGVNKKVASIFAFDFVQQSISSIYTIAFVDIPEEDDPMFG